jgi:hypothetical protein
MLGRDGPRLAASDDGPGVAGGLTYESSDERRSSAADERLTRKSGNTEDSLNEDELATRDIFCS